MHTAVGVVRAEDQGSAEYYGRLLADLHPKVRAELPDALDRDTELWVQEVLRRWQNEKHRPEAMGFTILSRDLTPGRIHLRENTAFPEWYLAHELGHALMGPSWETLPGVLSEGVCDWIASEVNPSLQATIRTHRILHATLFFGGMSYDVRFNHPETGEERRTRVWYTYDDAPVGSAAEVLSLDRWSFHSQSEVPVSNYGLGYLIVSRIAQRHGIEHLHQLCVDAREADLDVVPSEWILEAAGIGDVAGWWPATNDLLTLSEFEQVARIMPAVFRELPNMAFEGRFPELDAEHFLREVDPRLTLADGEVVHLADIEASRAQLIASRPSTSATEWR